MSGLGYIQSSPVVLILPHIYNCPPPGKKNIDDQEEHQTVKVIGCSEI